MIDPALLKRAEDAEKALAKEKVKQKIIFLSKILGTSKTGLGKARQRYFSDEWGAVGKFGVCE
jgi:hypothetical protein